MFTNLTSYCTPCNLPVPHYQSSLYTKAKDLQRQRSYEISRINNQSKNNLERVKSQFEFTNRKRRSQMSFEIQMGQCKAQLKNKEERLMKLRRRLSDLQHQGQQGQYGLQRQKAKLQQQHRKMLTQINMRIQNGSRCQNLREQIRLQYDTLSNEQKTLCNMLQIVNNQNILLRRKVEQVNEYCRKLQIQNTYLKQ